MRDIQRPETCLKSQFSIGPQSPQIVVLEPALWSDEFDPIVVEQVVHDPLLEASSIQLREAQCECVEPLAEGLLHMKAVRPIRGETVSAQRWIRRGLCRRDRYRPSRSERVVLH